jgi:hypothetical protein
MSFIAFDNGEDQWQSAAFIDQTDHQTNSPSANKTAIKRETISLRLRLINTL